MNIDNYSAAMNMSGVELALRGIKSPVVKKRHFYHERFPCRSVFLIILSLLISGVSLAQPNVLFIVVDDMNADLGSFGNSIVKSPNIDAFADKGVRFDAAYAQYPACTPSRSSFLTGLYPEQIGVMNNNVNFRITAPDTVSLPQYFRENGYSTARVGKIFHYGVPNEIGTNGMDDPKAWDEVRNPKGIDVRKDIVKRIETIYPDDHKGKRRLGGTLSWLNLPSEDEEHTDGKVAQEAISLLDQYHPSKTGKPFFIGVGFFRPHTPFVAPKKYFDLYPLSEINPLENPANDRNDIPVAALGDRRYQLSMDSETKKKVVQAYYASISFIDAQIGRVLAGLKEMGLEDDTVVVLLSDHGYQLGHHDLWQKGDVFEGSSRTPLIIYEPGNQGNGHASKSLVELVDLFPTLTEITGLKTPDHLVGRSLTPILSDPSQSVRQSALTMTRSRAGWTRGEYRNLDITGYSIRTERYRYTHWGDGVAGEELYDYEVDPKEFVNRSNSYKHMTVRSQLKSILQDRKESARANRDEWLDLSSPGGR